MTRLVDIRWQNVRQCVMALAAILAVTACSSPSAPAPKAAAPTSAPAAPTAAKPAEAATKPAEAAKPAGDAQKPAAPAVDFAGKTVRVIVGYAPGGGFDSTARIITP